MTATTVLPAVFVPHGAGPAFFMAGPLGQLFQPPDTCQLAHGAPGAPELAAAVVGHLRQMDIKAVPDSRRGWDHGVFVLLKVMYPDADIPVVAISLQAALDPEAHAAIGQALRPLREAGVLIVAAA